MSVLAQVIRNRQLTRQVYLRREQQQRRRAKYDWLFYVAVLALTFLYRSELLAFVEKCFNQLAH